MNIIARIHTDFPEKFGIPRQSNLIPSLKGRIVFEPEWRTADAVKGLEGFNYIWLLWHFDNTERKNFSATVTPPRLGGNTHVGVFATRSPFRPNNIGLSSVKLEEIVYTENGPELIVSGADLKDNTGIYDIKPYLPYTDCHPDATDGFAGKVKDYELNVVFPEDLLSVYPPDHRDAVIEILKEDPRPAYHEDPLRKYGVSFAGFDVHFTVCDGTLTVFEVVPL